MNKYEPDMDKSTKNEKPSDEAGLPPRLPVPSLKDTADSFTRWCTPILTNEQRAQTRSALNAFVKPNGLGVMLHKKMLEGAEQDGSNSWLDDYWTSRFLARRDPVVLNDNFFFLFRQGERERSRHAASLIAAALNYKLVLDQGQIPLAVERSLPTCENLFANLFATTRIPGEQQDSLARAASGDESGSPSPRHIVVFCRGNIFSLDLTSPDGQPHSLADIEKGLHEIVDRSIDEQATGRSIGHLTSLPRADWARTRVSLLQGSRNNAANLSAIENALFSVHLEDLEPADNLAACTELLHGNGANRWFDKSLQFIVFNDGYAGLNVEHSGLDRASIVDFLDYILGIDPNSIDQYSGAATQGTPQLSELAFDLPPVFQKKIARAAAGYDRQKTSVTGQVIAFRDYHAKLLEQKNISPDAFVHCALQLAWVRQNQQFAAMSQNISMRHYAYGRVQTMWSLSTEIIDFVTTMLDDKKADLEKFEALQKAAEQHKTGILDCRAGDLPEQHISELFNIYKRHPDEFQTDFLTRITSGGLSHQEIEKALALFTSSGWTSIQAQAINTSFLASPTVLHQGFGPVERHNIAAGCVIHATAINLYLCAGKDQQKMFDRFADDVLQALGELQDLLGLNLDSRESEPDDEL